MSKITYGDKSAINVNASIPEANKITDANMNDIKGAINQIGSFIPLTAGANADYYSAFKGTLETGDIFSGYFPLATNGSSNAKLSVNGSGGTYINLIYFDGTQVLGNEVSLKYKSMYYDGTNFVLLDESFSRTNTNGTYTRYKDGTMITYQEIEVEIACNTAWGNLFVGNYATAINFPQTFKELPKVLIDLKLKTGACFKVEWEVPIITTSSYKNIGIGRGTKSNAVNFTITLYAIGRWKA